MADQADTLRKLMQQREGAEASVQILESDTPSPGPIVLSVASGKGGVGKSCLVANLATTLARAQVRVMVVDCDYGLANLDILFGVQAEATVDQVLAGEARMQDALVGVEPNLWLLPSASGVLRARTRNWCERERVLSMLEGCPWEMDVIILDAGAGIHDSVLDLHSPSFRSLLVVTPEPTSLADGYALIKKLRQVSGTTRFEVVVNQVQDAREAQAVYQKLRDTASRFLDVEVAYLGHLARDEKIAQSVRKRKILVDWEPGAAFSKCIGLISKRIQRDLGIGVEGDVSGVGLSRFREEPAQDAPGNVAKAFFKPLLGEVNA